MFGYVTRPEYKKGHPKDYCSDGNYIKQQISNEKKLQFHCNVIEKEIKGNGFFYESLLRVLEEELKNLFIWAYVCTWQFIAIIVMCFSVDEG